MEVIEYPNGVCPKHGPRLAVNGIPQCVKCVAEAERATRAPRPVVNVKDPGHEAMSGIGGGASAKDLTRPGEAPVVHKGQQSISKGQPVGLLAIREAIYSLPMPKSLKQYKRFQKIQQLIDQAVEDDNAEAD